MNRNIILSVIAVVVLLGGVWYFSNNNAAELSMDVPDVVATSTDDMASTSNSTTTTVTSDSTTDDGTAAKPIPGYPANWPTDVPRYPVGSVKYTAPSASNKQAAVIFSTSDPVRSVVNFYLDGLVANGWKITESGNGQTNLITIRATKGTRGVGGYVERVGTKTNVTIGVNLGL